MQQQQQQFVTSSVGQGSFVAAPWLTPAASPSDAPTVPRAPYQHRKSTVLGSILIVVGFMSIAFNAVDVIVSWTTANEYSDYYYNGYDYTSLGFSGHGFWSGIMCIAAGSLGIAGGRRKTKCQIRCCLVLNILSIFFCFAQLGIAVGGATVVGTEYISGDHLCCPHTKCDYYGYYAQSVLGNDRPYYPDYTGYYGPPRTARTTRVPPKKFCREALTLLLMESLLGLMSVVALCCSFWIATLVCRTVGCCKETRVQQAGVNGIQMGALPGQQQATQMIPVPLSYTLPYPIESYVPPAYQFTAAAQHSQTPSTALTTSYPQACAASPPDFTACDQQQPLTKEEQLSPPAYSI